MKADGQMDLKDGPVWNTVQNIQLAPFYSEPAVPILGQFGSVLINRSPFGQKRSNGFDKIENESRDDRYMVLMNVHEWTRTESFLVKHFD